ncbi:hypothetical protein ACHAWF_017703 [Thalassiosira exigua]
MAMALDADVAPTGERATEEEQPPPIRPVPPRRPLPVRASRGPRCRGRGAAGRGAGRRPEEGDGGRRERGQGRRGGGGGGRGTRRGRGSRAPRAGRGDGATAARAGAGAGGRAVPDWDGSRVDGVGGRRRGRRRRRGRPRRRRGAADVREQEEARGRSDVHFSRADERRTISLAQAEGGTSRPEQERRRRQQRQQRQSGGVPPHRVAIGVHQAGVLGRQGCQRRRRVLPSRRRRRRLRPPPRAGWIEGGRSQRPQCGPKAPAGAAPEAAGEEDDVQVRLGGRGGHLRGGRSALRRRRGGEGRRSSPRRGDGRRGHHRPPQGRRGGGGGGRHPTRSPPARRRRERREVRQEEIPRRARSRRDGPHRCHQAPVQDDPPRLADLSGELRHRRQGGQEPSSHAKLSRDAHGSSRHPPERIGRHREDTAVGRAESDPAAGDPRGDAATGSHRDRRDGKRKDRGVRRALVSSRAVVPPRGARHRERRRSLGAGHGTYPQGDVVSLAVVGGQSITEQATKLRNGVHVVVGTPGRINDCVEMAYLVLNQCSYIVLDEADRMIDLGFAPQIEDILEAMGGKLKSEDETEAYRQEREDLERLGKAVPSHRLTAMFSATMPPEVERIARRYLRHPVVVSVGDRDSSKNARIVQRVVFLSSSGQKEGALKDLLRRSRPNEKIIVFVNEKKHADGVGRIVEQAGR